MSGTRVPTRLQTLTLEMLVRHIGTARTITTEDLSELVEHGLPQLGTHLLALQELGLVNRYGYDSWKPTKRGLQAVGES